MLNPKKVEDNKILREYFTDYTLKKMRENNIVVENPTSTALRCHNCGARWWAMRRSGGYLYRNAWKCPYGCSE